MKLFLSTSYPKSLFISEVNMLDKYNSTNKGQLRLLITKFKRTTLGKRLELLEKKKNPKSAILMSLHFDLQVTSPTNISAFEAHKHLRVEHLFGDKKENIARLILFFDSNKKSLKIHALGFDTKLIATLKPHNLKFNPDAVSLELYGVYILNLFRDIAIHYSVMESDPKIFAKLSEKHNAARE